MYNWHKVDWKTVDITTLPWREFSRGGGRKKMLLDNPDVLDALKRYARDNGVKRTSLVSHTNESTLLHRIPELERIKPKHMKYSVVNMDQVDYNQRQDRKDIQNLKKLMAGIQGEWELMKHSLPHYIGDRVSDRLVTPALKKILVKILEKIFEDENIDTRSG